MDPQVDVSRPAHRDLQVYAMKTPQIVCLDDDRFIFVRHITTIAIEINQTKTKIVFYMGGFFRTLELEEKTDATALLRDTRDLIAHGESLWFYIDNDGKDAVEEYQLKP